MELNGVCVSLGVHYMIGENKMSVDQEGGYVPSRYSIAYNNYSRNEIRSVIPILRSVARSCSIALKFPVYKVLKAVAKIFLLNEI